ncbi:MAG TPA: TadE/TadG family type IV pilus assembly protein [Streptosporangiaceae bacterium]|jgi:Flp pilus assembly protein TadG
MIRWRGLVPAAQPGQRIGRARRVGGHDSQSGNAALELIILAPVIILLICMVIAAGRIAIAQGSVDAAARDAARQASIARTPAAALAAAQASASADLAGDGLNCQTSSIVPTNLDAAFGTPLGQPASVTFTVSCTVDLSGLVLRGLPGSLALSSTFTSPLDPYRGRSLGLGPAAPAADPASGGA